MANKVGTKTGQKTSAGKDVYKTPEGESVSEKSVTIKFGENAYVNAPSIYKGKRYTEDKVKEMLLEGIIKPTSRHDTLEEAIEAAETRSDNLLKDGGMAKQMELFEPVERGFDDGGLMDEGGMVDEVSGNEVPPGSTREEVRDDIPANLSEGEFVFPADVVRYFGLEKLMEMRQEAKQGLQHMDDMGQMGNSDEAVIPDDLPFDINDLDMDNEDTQDFAVGGAVSGTAFTPLPASTTSAAPAPAGTAAAPVAAASSAYIPQLQNTVITPSTTTPARSPTFYQTVGTPVTPQVPQTTTGTTTPAQTTPASTSSATAGGDGGGGNDGTAGPMTTGTVTGYTSPSATMSEVGGFLTKDIETNANAFGGSKAFGMSNKALRSATLDQAMYQLGSITPSSTIASTLSREFGLTNASMNDMAVAGQQGKEAALTTLGFTRASQLQTSNQATMYGQMISAAHAAAKKGEDVTVALAKEMNNPMYAEVVKDAAVSAMQGLGYTSDKMNDPTSVNAAIGGYRAAADAYRADAAQSMSSGTVRDSKGNPVTSRSGVVMSQSARDRMNAELEAARTAEAKADAIAAEQARSRGNVARDDAVMGDVTDSDVSAAKAAAAAATDFDNYGDEFGNQPDSSTSSSASASSSGYRESTSGGGEFGGTSSSSGNFGSSTGTGDFGVSGNYSSADMFDGEEGDDSSGSDKIVCTAMNNAYGFGSFRQTVWLQHSKNMDPAYQKGYHRIFKPLIKFAYKDKSWYNMFVRNMLEGIARRRTADIWMQKHGKRHLRGAIERAILEPLCYIVGKIK
jgi:hypothetical protein